MDSHAISEHLLQQVNDQLSQYQGLAGPSLDVLTGKSKHSPVLNNLMPKLFNGTADVHDLARGYKHTPHGPVGLFYKYIVHRINHIDDYDYSTKRDALDKEFFRINGAGEAQEQHKNVTSRHLNEWIANNPLLAGGVLDHKNRLHQAVLSDVGLNVRKINGEPFVAMTRGLDTPFIGEEMALSSHSDLRNSGFGRHQHHVWVPLKDLWYSYPAAPSYPRGEHGHENEWLFSNTGPRYEARDVDVIPSMFSDILDTDPYSLHDFLVEGNDDNTVSQMIIDGHLPPDHADKLHIMKRLGPKTLAAALAGGSDPNQYADHPSIPREMALRLLNYQLENKSPALWNALGNPNLTSEDLKNVITHPNFANNQGLGGLQLMRTIMRVAVHPSFNESVSNSLIQRIFQTGNPDRYLPIIARHAKIPSLALHQAFIKGLDEGDDSEWFPEWGVARSFAKDVRSAPYVAPKDIPTAFNNSQNGDRYLKALMEFAQHSPERASNMFNIYHTFLSGARLSDTSLEALISMEQRGDKLPGLDESESQSDIVGELARWNEQLTERQKILLTKSNAGIQGLLNREDEIPSSVQLAIVENGKNIEDVRQLIYRHDLTTEAATALFRKAMLNPNDSNSIIDAAALASNPKLPEEIAKQASGAVPEERNPMQNAVANGLAERSNETGIVKPLPIGGIE